MSLFRNATFVRSAHKAGDLPPPDAPEVAFAGRSNAGKSSAINALAGHSRLAFVSKTPGRTQLINFFRLRGGAVLVDLPGYGYARVPEAVQRHWKQLVSVYLQTRESLQGLVLVMDVRHPLTPLDEALLDWFRPTGKPVHVLLTKADKLARGPAEASLRRVQARLADLGPRFTAQLFSALKRTGIDAAEEVLEVWLAPFASRNEGSRTGGAERGLRSPGPTKQKAQPRGSNRKAPRRAYEARGSNKKAPS